MKKIIIEISDDQHSKMMEHLQKGTTLNFENETFSGFGLNLNCVEGGISSWLEVEMNGILDLGEVDWKME
ncbi:hypothetical protein [Flavobacterium sp.]|jgi:hypothetical protein|uniref:hypothetical protein n=1 Tax=Flavobacterium sp. TaxID=239 RepID=UPI0037532921